MENSAALFFSLEKGDHSLAVKDARVNSVESPGPGSGSQRTNHDVSHDTLMTNLSFPHCLGVALSLA